MKVLFLCPDYFGIYKEIEKSIQSNFDCELTTVVFKNYKYKSVFHKILNSLAKVFMGRNLKKEWASAERVKSIAKNAQYDILFAISPEMLLNKDLERITKQSKKNVVYYWDSFKNIPRYHRTLQFFDKKFSFEKDDVAQLNLEFLTNFYFKEATPSETTLDVFFIGTFDKRYDTLKDIASKLLKANKTVKIILQNPNQDIIDKHTCEGIEFIKQPIPVSETESYLKSAKIILDIQKDIQKGLTFRVFEAMGLKKKLITTNKDIVNYDFYNPNNILVWDENKTSIPESFISLPYEELPKEIYEKYNSNNWIKKVLE
ncbi:hypothetical protein LZZ90_05935 [Flavobacterium sp. SM15]|uniref:hypothetical protein n=1 Tax=Flavobacterium sp. SM15 TaxID=2908005 RepID=UPI001EDC36B0|nr:hypothetical protein [Flavobacterium sp. SM15]MCG2611042.1 hypothetical protein [Flavobacterium sp. SM15]